MQTSPLTIEAVEQQFLQWRATKQHHRTKIPKYLWDKVKSLLGRYKTGQVIRRLHISMKQLQAQGLLPINCAQPPSSLQPPSFAKIDLDPLALATEIPSMTSYLTVESPNGMKLCLISPTLSQLQVFIKAFTE